GGIRSIVSRSDALKVAVDFSLTSVHDGWSLDFFPTLLQTRRLPDLESQRDSASKPRVARHELPWGKTCCLNAQPQRGCASFFHFWPQPRWGCHVGWPFTQGSSCLATLGFGTKSLWDLLAG